DDHVREIDAVDLLEQGHAQRAAAADDAVADLSCRRRVDAAREDEDLARLADVVEVLDDEDDGQEGETTHGHQDQKRERGSHPTPPRSALRSSPARIAGTSMPVVSPSARMTDATICGYVAA